MDKNDIIELSKICSNQSILVVHNTSVIYRVFCPFKAICVQAVEMYAIGQEVTVIAVKMSNNYKLVYVIQNKGYYHHYFMIITKPPPTSYNP